MTDLLGDQTTNTAQQINGGTIMAYATTTERLPLFPDLPVVTEANVSLD